VKLEHEVVIARPPEDVFDFLANPENLLLWQSSLVKLRRIDPLSHVEVRAVLGKKFRQTLEVTTYDPPAQLDYEVIEGPFRARLSHRLEPVPGGTRVTVVGEGDPGRLRLGEPVLARVVKRQSKHDFERLKAFLESEE